MPITGTSVLLGDAMHAGREAVLKAFLAQHPAPTGADYTELRKQMSRSDAQVILAHLTANGLVVGAVTSGVGSGGIVTGTIT